LAVAPGNAVGVADRSATEWEHGIFTEQVEPLVHLPSVNAA